MSHESFEQIMRAVKESKTAADRAVREAWFRTRSMCNYRYKFSDVSCEHVKNSAGKCRQKYCPYIR